MIDSKTFEIKFTKDNPLKKITGTSVGKPFLNPYSGRSFSTVTTTLYENCELSSQATKVAGITTIAAFQQAVIRETDVSLISSS